MAATFSRGTLSLPVGPYPHILVFLFALVWLVPVGLGLIADPAKEKGARLLAVYVASVAMLPAALGRCDPLHVMFNGVGVLVLSLLLVSRTSHRVRMAWVAAIALLVFWNQRVNDTLFELRTAYILRQTVMPHVPAGVRAAIGRMPGRNRLLFLHALVEEPRQPEFQIDTAQLGRIVGANGTVIAPLALSPTVEQELKDTHHYSPTYYAFLVDMMNPAAEQRVVDEMDRQHWMLMPDGWKTGGQPLPKDVGMFQGLNLHYRERNAPLYLPGLLIKQDQDEHWVAVRKFGPYVLYEHKDPGPARGA